MLGPCRYVELDTLLQELIQLERLRVTELNHTVIQNGSRTWSLPPQIIELGQQWAGEEQESIPFDNRQLLQEDSQKLAGTFHMKDFNGT